MYGKNKICIGKIKNYKREKGKNIKPQKTAENSKENTQKGSNKKH